MKTDPPHPYCSKTGHEKDSGRPWQCCASMHGGRLHARVGFPKERDATLLRNNGGDSTKMPSMGNKARLATKGSYHHPGECCYQISKNVAVQDSPSGGCGPYRQTQPVHGKRPPSYCPPTLPAPPHSRSKDKSAWMKSTEVKPLGAQRQEEKGRAWICWGQGQKTPNTLHFNSSGA